MPKGAAARVGDFANHPTTPKLTPMTGAGRGACGAPSCKAAPDRRRDYLPPQSADSRLLRDLPIIFHDNEFLGRYLRIFEAIWEPLEWRHDQIQMYFVIRAESGLPVNHGKSACAEATWNVLPFTATDLQIEPQLGKGRSQAQYMILVRNAGNDQADFALHAADKGRALSHTFDTGADLTPTVMT